MTTQEIVHQLQRIASADDFPSESEKLTQVWSSAGVGLDAVEPIIRFIEGHPTTDFGAPGPLVHFVERFYQKGYEEKLVESVQRKPTSLTVWMLNRIINGTRASNVKRELIAVMENVHLNPLADQDAIQRANRFLERFNR